VGTLLSFSLQPGSVSSFPDPGIILFGASSAQVRRNEHNNVEAIDSLRRVG